MEAEPMAGPMPPSCQRPRQPLIRFSRNYSFRNHVIMFTCFGMSNYAFNKCLHVSFLNK